jgi:hypothetical protein
MKMPENAVFTSDWISLTKALDLVATAVGKDNSWDDVRRAIRDGMLKARGRVEGVDVNVKKEWLSVLAFDDPSGDALLFDNEKRFSISPVVPSIVDDIEVQKTRLQKIWSITDAEDAENDGSFEKNIYFKLGKKDNWDKMREATKQRWERCLSFAIRVGSDHVERTQIQMATEVSILLGNPKDSPTAIQTGLNKYFIDWANPDPH